MEEVFLADAEKVEFPRFRTLRPVKTAPCGDEHGSGRIRTDHGGSQEGEWVYTAPCRERKWKSRLIYCQPVRRVCCCRRPHAA